MVGTTITIESHSVLQPTESISHSELHSDSDTASSSGLGAQAASAGSHEVSDPSELDDEDWPGYDEIEPSDSASRPRTRYRSASRGPAVVRTQRRHSAAERTRRAAPRLHRHPAPGPPSSVDHDDYPGYGRGYAQPAHGAYGGRSPLPGYSHSSYSSGNAPYTPPFHAAPGALTQYAGGYPGYHPAAHPFSPNVAAPGPGPGGYFHPHHGSGHSTPAAFPGHAHGHEVMAYPAQHAYPPYAGYPGAHPPMPPHMAGYYPQWPAPVDPATVADPELEKKLVAVEELMKTQQLDYEKAKKALADRDAKEAKERADAEAAAAAAAAKKTLEERHAEEKAAAEKRLADEKATAEKRMADEKAEWERKSAEAKAEWEKKVSKAETELSERLAKEEKARQEAEAAAAAEKLKAEWEKKLEEEKKAALKKGAEDALKKLEDAKKKEEEKKAANPAPEDKKKPIRFKDAVGRKFSFPFHLCATWVGMEELIKQAFLHVDVIGPHVQEGHYDLIGPNGEIILPQVWETMIEPDWSITMTMWPIHEPRHGMVHPGRPRSRSQHAAGAGRGMPPGVGAIPVPPNVNWPPGAGRSGGGMGGGRPASVLVMNDRDKSGKKKTEGKGMFAGFFAGGKPASKPSSKGKKSKK